MKGTRNANERPGCHNDGCHSSFTRRCCQHQSSSAQDLLEPPLHPYLVAVAKPVVDLADDPVAVDDVSGRQGVSAKAPIRSAAVIHQYATADLHLSNKGRHILGVVFLGDADKVDSVTEASSQTLEHRQAVA